MFIVRWLPCALDQLTALWKQATDRDAVTRATDLLDQRLQRDPHGESESREGNNRVLLEAPLGALIRIDENRRIVYVIKIT